MFAVASVWEKEVFQQKADVIIVGGGLLGLWTAYEIKRSSPGLMVRVLEAHQFPQGASTRNAGFACFGSPTELLHDAHTLGEEKMLQVAEGRYKGIRKMLQVFDGADVGYEPCGGYECLLQLPEHFEEKLEHLNHALQPVIHHANTFRLTPERMGMQGFGAMVHNQYEGCLHSGKLLDAMSALVQDCGVQVLYGTPVEAWHATGSGWMVKAGGRDFEAAQLVLATNAWLSTQVPDLRIKPARGQVIVTKPLPGLQLNGTFHFDEGFYYWRHLPGGRILLGGARNADFGGEETLDTGISQSIQHKLETFLLDHFPQYFSTSGIHDLIDHRWSGFMAMSPDKMPVLAQPQPGLHVAMCCNGMGVALAPVHAEAVAQAVIEQA